MFRTSRPWGPPKIILAVFFGQALTYMEVESVSLITMTLTAFGFEFFRLTTVISPKLGLWT